MEKKKEMDGIITSGYVKCKNEIIRSICNEIDTQSALMYIILLSHRNTNTGNCYPSIKLLAKECNVSVSTAKRLVDKLHTRGYIIIDSGRERVCSSYFFPRECFYMGEGGLAVRRKKGSFRH